ncbi:ABC transporter substrate-binding protein [Streptomyces antnestii]|uniref:ABC transporter substrate-binding protein n=1 Tax=Streptomyces antnestii TaxID=2494256 RepID=A0A437PNH4_9ACTN|nr:ABC transporter substrate-binding protein [Streptomyces sp. San01]RVU23699.1 ABC transporter substrate-binding protein [Streptomyces sp. San01]
MRGSSRLVAAIATGTLLAGSSACSVEDPSAKGGGGNGRIKIALSAGVDMLDPQRSASGPDLAIMNQIYETLLDLDKKTHKLVPKLATSYKLVTPTTWRFELRKGVKFTNGEPFDAEAVKYSIERILDPKTTSSVSASQIASVKEVKAVDEYTVDIVTKYPDPVLPRRMQPFGGTGRVYIVPPKYFSEAGYAKVAEKPIGTGPYKLASWNKGQSVTVSPNTSYWGRKPQVTGATFVFVPEDKTRVDALRAHEVDMIERVPVEEVKHVDDADGVHVASSHKGLVNTVLLDMRKPPFDNPKVREAFAHAIDVKGIVDELLKGHGRVLNVPMDPDVKQFDKSIQPYSYDPKKSRELLKEAGYTGKLTLHTKTSEGRYPADKQIYEAMNQQLDAAGFDIKPQTVEWGRLINQMTSGSAGPFYIIGWDFGEGDASKLNSFIQSSATSSIARIKEFDDLSAEAGRTTDEKKNTELWQKAQKVIHDQYAVGAMWQPDAMYGLSDRMVWTPEMGEGITLQDIRLK